MFTRVDQALTHTTHGTESNAAGPPDSARRSPRVSIGMPVHDAERFLPAAIEAVLAQTFADFELVICDNASTDRSLEICLAYQARDPRIRVLQNAVNLGANPNYRRVAEAARGEFFKWASANDLIAPDFIERCVAALERQPETVLAFGCTVLFDSDPRSGRAYDDQMELQEDDAFDRYRRCVEGLRLNNLINGLIRREALRRTPVMPDYHSSDNVVVGHLALAGKFARVPEAFFYRRMDRESATRLQSADVVRRHHYPRERFSSFFQTWQLAMGHLGAVLASRLPVRRRLRALAYVGHRLYWQAPRLIGDVREALRFCVLRRRG
jgi:glycosyltransferase involved in cell wall biosynthesis